MWDTLFLHGPWRVKYNTEAIAKVRQILDELKPHLKSAFLSTLDCKLGKLV